MRVAPGSFPTQAVVDASVLIKVFLPEDGSDVATALLQPNPGDTIVRVVPDLAFAECGNIFWKLARRGTLSADVARQTLTDLCALPLEVWPTESLVESALATALARDVTVYDATYAALAELLDVPLITADLVLVRKLGGPSGRVRPLDSFGVTSP